MNQEKSVLVPTQEIEFLGIAVNSVSMELKLPVNKLTEEDPSGGPCHGLHHGPRSNCTSICQKPIPPTREDERSRESHHSGSFILLESPERSGKFLEQQWTGLRGLAHPIRDLSRGPTVVDIRSTSVEPQVPSDERDSLLDRVRCFPDRVGGGVPGPEDRRSVVPAGESMAINCLELLAADLAVRTFLKDRSNVSVLLRLDKHNSSVLHQRHGGHNISQANMSSQDVVALVTGKDIWLVAQHLPGATIQIADAESRKMRDNFDWKLNTQVFNQIQQALGPLDIDLFASRLTHQLPRFIAGAQTPGWWRPMHSYRTGAKPRVLPILPGV